MPTQHQTDRLYMSIAHRVAEESYCVRRKVGCVIYTPTLATVIGFNGTAPGSPNVCELPDGTTDPRVVHAEMNCKIKADIHGICLSGSTCYVTLSPCMKCASMLIESDVYRVVYSELYRDDSGILELKRHGIIVDSA